MKRTSIKLVSKKVVKKIRLRTWISFGIIAVLLPIIVVGLVKVIFVIGAPPVASAIWNFDEGSGTTTNDASNNSNSGTLTNGFWGSRDFCVSENCLFLNGADGTGDYVNRADDADFDFDSTDSFTFSIWIRYGASANGTIILDKNGAAGGIYRIQIESDGDITCGIDDDTTYGPEDSVTSTAATYDDNRWHHVACVKSSNTSLTLYIDGQSVGTPDTSFTATGTLANNGGFTLGANVLSVGAGTDYTGFIDEFRMYRQALTAAEIKTEYNLSSAIRFAPRPDAFSNGLVGRWMMDETVADGCVGGTNDSCDASGSNLDAAWANDTTTSTTSKYGRSTDYDGTNDSAAVSDNNVLSANNTNFFTVAAWIYPDANSGTQDVISKGNTSNFEWALGGSGSTAQAVVYDSAGSVIGQATASSSFSTGVWQHFVMTIDLTKSTINLYKNGALVGTGTISGTYTNGTANARFGERADGSNDYDGKIDDVRIYNRLLSGGEISGLYNFAPSPVGYWKFDEATGTSVADSSGYNHAATITDGGAVTGGWDVGKFGGTYNMRGNDDADVVDMTDFDLGTRNTVSFWVNFFDLGGTGGANDAVVGGNSTAADSGYMFYADNSDIYSRQALASGVSVTASFTSGTWYHISVVRDGTSIKFYRDGNQLGATQTYGSDNAFTMKSLTNFAVGAASFPLEGKIDELRVYNYARNATQVIEDMNAGHPAGGSPIGTETLYWKFSEAYGTTAHDEATSTTTNGTLTNIASPATSTSGWNLTGKIDGAVTFDGSNDQITIATASDSEVDFNGSESFSACAWTFVTTMPSTNEKDAIITKWDETSTTRGYRLVVTNDDADTTGNFSADIYDESADQTISVSGTNDSVSTSTWYHVCMTFNGGTGGAAGDLVLYVNGINKGSNSANGSFAGLEDVTADFTVGDYDATDAVAANTAFTGKIDEVEVFAGALTTDQVLIVYNANASSNFAVGTEESSQSVDGSGNPPVVWLSFEENSLNTCTGGSEDVCDRTGNDRDGLFANNTHPAPNFLPGIMGSAVRLNNSTTSDSDYSRIELPDNTLNSTTAGTIEFWFKSDDSSTWSFQAMAYIGDELGVQANGIEMAYNSTNNNFEFFQSGCVGTNIRGTAPLNGTNTLWHHIAFTDNSSGNVFYIDGVKANFTYTSGSASTDCFIDDINAASGATVYYLGCEGNSSSACFGTEKYAGLIDEYKIYDYVRTPYQIAYDYNRGKPVGWWKFDDCTGTTANDSSDIASITTATKNGTWSGSGGGNTSAGTCTAVDSATAWYNGRNGKYNSSLDFDGTDDVVTVSNSDPIDLNAGLSSGFTWSGWVYPNSDGEADTGIIFSKGTNTYCDTKTESAGRVSIECRLDQTTDAAFTATTTIPINTWSHIALSWTDDSDDEITIWVNGIANTSTATFAGPTAAESNSFLIGNNAGGTQTFDGQIDDVRMYSYEMNAAQIKKLINEASGARFGPTSGTP